MGKFSHANAAHAEFEEKRPRILNVPMQVPLRQSHSKAGNNGTESKQEIVAMSLNNLIEGLERRKYFEPGGAVRDNWNAVYGKTLSEAWDNAYNRGQSFSPQVEDYQVICIKDAIRAAKWTPEMDRARKRAREAVEKGLRGIQGLPPNTRHRAMVDAELLASLIVLKDSKMPGWDNHYSLMVGIKEIWDSGFGRYAIVDGKHLIYGIRTERPMENIIRLESPT